MLLALPVPGALAAPASFAPPVFYGAPAPNGIDTGDLDGDGNRDVVATGAGASILLGNGAGGFGTASQIQALSGRSIEILDLNLDGKLDLAAGTLNTPSVAIALGTGTGAFGPVARYGPARADNDTGIASGDFNEDGIPDLAIPGAGNTVATVLGTGAGQFGAPASFPVGSLPNGVAVGDFDQDGHADLAVPNANSHSISVLPGTGTGSFGPTKHYPVGLTPRDVSIADFNADGRPDIAAANISSGTVSVLYGTATGFESARHFAAGQAPSSISVGDLNGDRRPDMVVASGSNVISQLAASSSGGFEPPVHHQAGTAPADVAVADLNRDGRLDLAVANGGTQNVSVHLNTTDTIPPQTTITDGPSGVTNDPSPAFSFEADEQATFACSLDRGTPSYSPCTSGDTFPVAVDGDYTFRVRAIDAVGNVDPTPATRELSVDTNAPETTITAGPSGPTDDATPTFEFETDEHGTFACSLDQGTATYTACTSGETFSIAADGDYTFRVRATDAAGNTDATPDTREFSVDTNAPETTITWGPSGLTADATPTFEFEADEPGTFECSLDQGTTTYIPCASGDTFSIAADGDYTFRVRATDDAGNTDATPATRDLTLDRTPGPVFDFTGFFQPVDNLPTLNLTSPGQGVAIKFSLGGDHGLDVLAAGYPKSEQIACDPSVEIDGIESTTSAGSDGLKYDPETDTYTYVWKTQRNWAGTCRQLVVKFTDGQSQRATFKFRR